MMIFRNFSLIALTVIHSFCLVHGPQEIGHRVCALEAHRIGCVSGESLFAAHATIGAWAKG